MKEHKWRKPLPEESQEENGYCEDCGKPASQGTEPCSKEAVLEKTETIPDAPPAEKSAHVSKRQAKKDALAKKGNAALADPSLAAEEPEESETLKDLVVEGSLIVKSPSGKSSVTISVRDEVAGVWIQSSGSKDRFPYSVVSLYDDGVQGPVIGLYKDTAEKGLQMTIAIGLDADGNPMIQVPNGRGNVGYVGLGELMDAVKPGWR